MLYTYHLKTPPEGFLSITAQVKGAVAESGVQSGICVVFCPHTTAGITINENADPDVQTDLLLAYRHFRIVQRFGTVRETLRHMQKPLPWAAVQR